MNSMRVARVVLHAALLAASVAVWSGNVSAVPQHQTHAIVTSGSLVDKVRQATEPFQDIEIAKRAGYEAFLGCVSGPQEGAMGLHFVNNALVSDGDVDATGPEALIYESGRRHAASRRRRVRRDCRRLERAPCGAAGAVLEGQTFQFNGAPNRFGLPPFYELHVWAWRDNPNGSFVDWNTRVSCEGQ